jgi:AraC-like DNA-binding protein
MDTLFQHIDFACEALLWDHKKRTDRNFTGFYHWHQAGEILFVHQGHGFVIVNQQTYVIKPGMLFLFQPYQLHKVYVDVSEDQPYERTLIHFNRVEVERYLVGFPKRYDYFIKLCKESEIDQVYDVLEDRIEINHILSSYAENMIDLDPGGGSHTREEGTLLMLRLISLMQQYSNKRRALASTSHRNHPRRYSETIMEWLETHYGEPFQLEELAEQLHLSKFYVSRVFRQETGSSIMDYLTARRMKQACRLLQTTSLSVEQIGDEVGLPNPSYFIQLFKRVVGTTPLKYRNKQVKLTDLIKQSLGQLAHINRSGSNTSNGLILLAGR